MTPLNGTHRFAGPDLGGTTTPDPFLAKLVELADLASATWPNLAFVLVGYAAGDPKPRFRLPCPQRHFSPAEGSNADLILQALAEADRPLTLAELSFKAVADDPSGAFRRALRMMVNAGHVKEHPGPPRTYEQARPLKGYNHAD